MCGECCGLGTGSGVCVGVCVGVVGSGVHLCLRRLYRCLHLICNCCFSRVWFGCGGDGVEELGGVMAGGFVCVGVVRLAVVVCSAFVSGVDVFVGEGVGIM